MGLLSNIFNRPDKNTTTLKVSIDTDSEEPGAKQVELSDNDPDLLASLQQEGDAKSIAHNLPHSRTCPNCGVMFDKPIKRKKKCPDCKNTIYVRTTQTLFPSSALTEEQLNHAEFYETMRAVVGITKDNYRSCENTLKNKWDIQKVNTYDVLWSLFNDHKIFMRNVDKTNEKRWQMIEFFRMQQTVGLAAARYQGNRGYDPEGYLKVAHSNTIQSAKIEEYVQGLTVSCYNCCDACQKFNKKTFSIQFLENKPVLPIPTCTRPLKEDSKFTFCTCMYQSYWRFD